MSRIEIPAGLLLAGSERAWPEEKPVTEVEIEAFSIERAPVTVGEFAAFVEDTGYATTAETLPGGPCNVPGSIAFRPSSAPVDLRRLLREHKQPWWIWRDELSWRVPLRIGLLDHPVTHVSIIDAEAYCEWAGGRLPTEHEWEWAARGGTTTEFIWGDDYELGHANTWEGVFPYRRKMFDVRAMTSPVGMFEENGYGLVDMIGNVWEMTSSRWAGFEKVHSCCAPSGRDPDTRGKVEYTKKGGSFACSPQYCDRYRPSARQPVGIDDTTAHNGFRVASDRETVN